MPASSGPFSFESSFRPGTQAGRTRQRRPDPDAATVLVIANFSGSNTSPNAPASQPVTVTIDNLDEVFAGFGARLTLTDGASGGGFAFTPATLEDFHPDALLQKNSALREILAARRELDGTGAARAESTLQRLLSTVPPKATSAPAASAPEESNESLLARLLGSTPPAAAPATPAPAAADPQAIIRQILAGSSSVVPAPTRGAAGLAAAAELALAERLRAMLRDAAFKPLEAAWRGLDFLVRRCPDEERVRYIALDLAPHALAADAARITRIMQDIRCSIVVFDQFFGNDAAGLAALEQLSTMLPDSVRIVAGAAPALAGSASFGTHPDPDDWTAVLGAAEKDAFAKLRSSPCASRIHLAAPRFLLRQPYGRAGEAIESFRFEELTDPPDHEHFAWGSGAYLAAQAWIVAQAADEDLTTADGAAIVEELPPARYLEHGGTALRSGAESWLPDRAVERLNAAGLTALQAVRNSDRVRVRVVAVAGEG